MSTMPIHIVRSLSKAIDLELHRNFSNAMYVIHYQANSTSRCLTNCATALQKKETGKASHHSRTKFFT